MPTCHWDEGCDSMATRKAMEGRPENAPLDYLPVGSYVVSTSSAATEDAGRSRELRVRITTSLGDGKVSVTSGRLRYSRTRRSATVVPIKYNHGKDVWEVTGKSLPVVLWR